MKSRSKIANPVEFLCAGALFLFMLPILPIFLTGWVALRAEELRSAKIPFTSKNWFCLHREVTYKKTQSLGIDYDECTQCKKTYIISRVR